MSSNDKKLWKNPDLQAFANAEAAIAYYTERGMPEHVAAVKRLFAEAERRRHEAKKGQAHGAARK